MGSSTVNAQKLANKTNLQIAKETNQANMDIADAANELNYKMFNEQNDWNLQRRDEEWAYNDPSAQMERYLKAGINPLWAMSDGDAGKAQQLTSASPADTVTPDLVTPTVAPEYDPNRIGNIVAAANNVNNSFQGFYKLALEQQDVQTRQSLASAQIAQSQAETLLTKSQTVSNDFTNKVNSATYDVVVGTKQKEYDKLIKEIEKYEADTELSRSEKERADALKEQLIAGTKKIESETFDRLENIKMAWFALKSNRINANAAQTSADASMVSANAAAKNAETMDASLNHQIEKDQAELKTKTIDQLIDILKNTRTTWDAMLGNLGNSLANNAVGDPYAAFDAVLAKMNAAFGVICDKYYSNPTSAGEKAVNDAQKLINTMPKPNHNFFVTPESNAQGFSIINPISQPSQPWNVSP